MYNNNNNNNNNYQQSYGGGYQQSSYGGYGGNNYYNPSQQQQQQQYGNQPYHYQQQQQQQRNPQQFPENDLSIYIGDLAPDVTESQLLNIFQSKFPSARGAKIIMDPQTGLPKGYGFIKFLNEAERDRALIEMQGYHINNRSIKVNNPTHKRLTSQLSTIPDLSSTDPTNTAIYVSQLDYNIDEGVLQTIFGAYGEISFIKMLNNKFSAFVNYVRRESAEAAFGLNNYQVGNTRLKVQWGKNIAPPLPQSRSPTFLPNQQQQPPPQYEIGYSQQDYDQQQKLIYGNYNPSYTYFSKEKTDITNAYSVDEENKAYMSWNKSSFKNNFYSSNLWNLTSQKDGPDSNVFSQI